MISKALIGTTVAALTAGVFVAPAIAAPGTGIGSTVRSSAESALRSTTGTPTGGSTAGSSAAAGTVGTTTSVATTTSGTPAGTTRAGTTRAGAHQSARPAAATQGLTARQAAARRAAAARTARLSRDMVGIMPSLYRGKYFSPRYESTRRCIVKRESNGYYRIENRYSSAAGAYQFLLSTSNSVARTMKRPDLVGVPASRWNRLEQDQAFWTLWNHGRGAGHWSGGSHSC